jgi:hypothetical protein
MDQTANRPPRDRRVGVSLGYGARVAVNLALNSRKFLGALANLSAELGQPANAIQVANGLNLDAYETTECMVELLGKMLIHYAADVFGEWNLQPHHLQEPLMIRPRGRQVLDGTD